LNEISVSRAAMAAGPTGFGCICTGDKPKFRASSLADSCGAALVATGAVVSAWGRRASAS